MLKPPTAAMHMTMFRVITDQLITNHSNQVKQNVIGEEATQRRQDFRSFGI